MGRHVYQGGEGVKRIVWVVALVGLAIAGISASVLAATSFASPAFQSQWTTDEARLPNFWGPLANATDGLYEPYQQAVGGVRLVQYFDKGRMELTNGTLTNGLLATELTTGQMQMGDAQFQFMPPPEIPIAGDPDGPGPTYAGLFRNGQSLFQNASPAVGSEVRFGVQPNGMVTGPIALPGGSQAIGTYDTNTSHNVAAVFATYRNTAGLQTIGFAKSEPFTMTARVGGVPRAVMAQVFERRVLTFTPDNPVQFQVEMGNIGRQYYAWRYSTQPTPVPTVSPAAPPRFTSGPERTELTNTSATFEWRTDQPTTSRLLYDTERDRVNYRFATGSTTNFVTRHRVTISNLSPSTVYFVRYAGQNQNGQVVEPPTTSSFQTLTVPPTVGTTITAPVAGERVTSPLTVRGTEDGSAFEGNLVIRLRDRTTNTILVSQPTTVNRPDIGQPGTWQTTLNYLQPTTENQGTIEVVVPPVLDGDVEQVRTSVNVVLVARPNNPGAGVLNIRWEWASTITANPIGQSVVPDPQNYTIVFRPNGTVSIKADCNQVNGTYTADTVGNVTIQLGPSTLVACPPGSLADMFRANLEQVRAYGVADGALSLYYGPSTNNNRMVFRNGGPA
jgi:hypothetical protein